MGETNIAQVRTGVSLSPLRPTHTHTHHSLTCRLLFQVIAFICGTIVIVLMIMALSSSDWLMAAGWRQGLFAHCIAENAPTPLPFGVTEPAGCYPARDESYIQAAAALCVVTLLSDIVATVLTGLGLRSKEYRKKYKYYRIAVYVMILSCK